MGVLMRIEKIGISENSLRIAEKIVCVSNYYQLPAVLFK